MTWSWLAVAALGAGHGLNPGMGWLFAVALGLQAGRSGAVWRALPPLAVGHALAVAAAALTAAALGWLIPLGVLKWVVGVALFTLGVLRLARHRHPRYGGMQVGFRELTTWSFLMATAHGAGLMVLPLVVGKDAGMAGMASGHATHSAHLANAALVPAWASVDAGLWAAAVHTAGYLLVTGLIAVTVYKRLGLRLLRVMWINLDLIWGSALLVTGALTLIP